MDTYFNKDKTTPFHVHYGQNYLRAIVFLLLVGIMIISVYSIKYMGWTMIPIIVADLFGLSCIRIPRIYLFNEGFEIEKKCIIDKFSDRDYFKFNEIVNIEFSEGKIDWYNIIVIILFRRSSIGGESRADRMILKTTDNKTFYFNRFGTRKNFQKTIELINEKSPAPNTR